MLKALKIKTMRQPEDDVNKDLVGNEQGREIMESGAGYGCRLSPMTLLHRGIKLVTSILYS